MVTPAHPPRPDGGGGAAGGRRVNRGAEGGIVATVNPSRKDAAWRAAVWIAAAVLLVAVALPVVRSPVLPTQDGPSHVYNAFVTHRVSAGDTLWTSHFTLGPALAPNRTTHLLLLNLGPALGWSAAERAVVLIATGLPFLAILGWQRSGTGRLEAALAPVAAWMSTSWFLWKGFYDFSISIGLFALLALLLHRSFERAASGGGERRDVSGEPGPEPPGSGGSGAGPTLARWRRLLGRHLPVQLLLGLLLFTHLFTFTASVALVAFHFAHRAWRKEGPWWELVAALPGALALVMVVTGGTLGGGELDWWPLGLTLENFILGAWSISFDSLDGAAGAIMTVGLLSLPLVRRVRDGGRLSGFELFAYLSVLLSFAAPSHVGTGIYAPERMRILGLLLLLPSASRALDGGARVRWLGRLGGAALAVLLVLHVRQALDASREVRDNLVQMRTAFERSDVSPGTEIQGAYWNPLEKTHRIAALVHLVDRVALEMELVDLDDYEAPLPVFRVNWRVEPWKLNPVAVSLGGRPGWLLELEPGETALPRTVLVLHERSIPLMTRHPAVWFGRRAGQAGRWAVGRVHLRYPAEGGEPGEGNGP